MAIPTGQSKAQEAREHLSKSSHAPAVRRVRKDPFVLAAIPQDELTPKVQSAMSELMREIDRLKDELDSAHKKVSLLENIAEEDPLVPILNRRGFMKEVERTISYAKRYKTPATILYIDVNFFKQINDTHGHKVGDMALLHITNFLIKNIRQSDVAGRIGGDEFAIILQNADKAGAEIKAGQLIENLKNAPCVHEDLNIPMQISIGAAELNPDDTPEAVLDRADREMYEKRHKARTR